MGAGCCDNKAFGEPCADCAFDDASHESDGRGDSCGWVEAPFSDPHRSALSFGVISARALEAAGAHWAVAYAAEIYRRAGLPRGGRVDDHVSAVEMSVLSGQQPIGAGLPETTVGPANDLAEVDGGDPWRSIVLKGGNVTPGRACCLVAFEYPVTTPKKFRKRGAGSTVSVGWEFKVLAIFKKSGMENGRACSCESCECCEFVQLRAGEQRWAYVNRRGEPTPGAEPRVTPKSGEDCAVGEKTLTFAKYWKLKVKGPICFGDGEESLRYSEERDEAGLAYEYESATGDLGEDAPPEAQAAVDAQLSAKGLRRDDVCVYFMRDKPQLTSGPGVQFTYNMCFKGQVWQRSPCSRSIEREEEFRLKMKGRVVTFSDGSSGANVVFSERPMYTTPC